MHPSSHAWLITQNVGWDPVHDAVRKTEKIDELLNTKQWYLVNELRGEYCEIVCEFGYNITLGQFLDTFTYFFTANVQIIFRYFIQIDYYL